MKGKLSQLGFLIVIIGALLLNFTSPPFQLAGVAIFLLGLLRPVLEPVVEKAMEFVVILWQLSISYLGRNKNERLENP